MRTETWVWAGLRFGAGAGARVGAGVSVELGLGLRLEALNKTGVEAGVVAV